MAAELGEDVGQRAQRERIVLVGKAALRLRDLLHPHIQLRALAQRGLAAAPPGPAAGLSGLRRSDLLRYSAGRALQPSPHGVCSLLRVAFWSHPQSAPIS